MIAVAGAGQAVAVRRRHLNLVDSFFRRQELDGLLPCRRERGAVPGDAPVEGEAAHGVADGRGRQSDDVPPWARVVWRQIAEGGVGGVSTRVTLKLPRVALLAASVADHLDDRRAQGELEPGGSE